MTSLIVAMSNNRVIGHNNKMPWHEPEDLKYFRKITTGNAVIMGRKTFESIGNILPNRLNIVITRQSRVSDDKNLVYAKDISEAIKAGIAFGNNPIIIGGAEIYKLALDHVDKMYITTINKNIEGDTYFPEYDNKNWKEVEKRESGNLTFKVLERIK